MDTKNCQDHCPKCNSEDISLCDNDYGADGQLYKIFYCDNCQCSFTETYRYSETDYDK